MGVAWKRRAKRTSKAISSIEHGVARAEWGEVLPTLRRPIVPPQAANLPDRSIASAISQTKPKTPMLAQHASRLDFRRSRASRHHQHPQSVSCSCPQQNSVGRHVYIRIYILHSWRVMNSRSCFHARRRNIRKRNIRLCQDESLSLPVNCDTKNEADLYPHPIQNQRRPCIRTASTTYIPIQSEKNNDGYVSAQP